MRHQELFKAGIMLFVSWKVFEEYEKQVKYEYKTCFDRPVWSPVLTCEAEFQETDKNKWNKIHIVLYDVTQMRYVRWPYKHCLDWIEDGTIEIIG